MTIEEFAEILLNGENGEELETCIFKDDKYQWDGKLDFIPLEYYSVIPKSVDLKINQFEEIEVWINI